MKLVLNALQYTSLTALCSKNTFFRILSFSTSRTIKNFINYMSPQLP